MKRLLILLLACLSLAAVSSCDTDDGLDIEATLEYTTLGGISGNTDTYSYNHRNSVISDEDVFYIFRDISQDMALQYGNLRMDVFQEVTKKFLERRSYEFVSDDGNHFTMKRLQ